MPNTITNYDGSITTTPQQLVYPETAEDIQAILRDSTRYPSPVRAKGSYHSLTPCVSTDGTIVDMSKMTKVISIDRQSQTFTAQAGLQIIDASKQLREHDLQFMTNIEIGNMTLGASACNQSKDALDGIEFGQMNSYLVALKWVTPTGDLAEASEATNPDLLRCMRASYGLAGIVYEVTYRIKPVEALHFTYLPRPLKDLTQEEVDHLLDTSEGLICWTVNRTCIFQQRKRITEPGLFASILALARRRLWNYGDAHVGHFLDEFVRNKELRDKAQDLNFDITNFLYESLHLIGGITLLAPDKTIDYRHTPQTAKYAFTFWAFPRSKWLTYLREYVDFADDHFKRTGFRCNMPLGAYHIRRDQHSLLSEAWDEEIFSLDPIHSSTDDTAWHNFLREFNQFAYERKGIPLLNQSPFVERKHVEAAYGDRWSQLAAWLNTADPHRRMRNAFFADLLPQ